MLRPRIIPCLLVHKGGLVKTVQFKSPKYVGDPINAVKIFNEKEADELTVLDIDATINGAAPDYTLIQKLAAECRMPLCYGGGISTVEQAKQIVGLGVEKIALGSVAINNTSLITEIAQMIGRQSVVAVLDIRKKAGLFKSGYELCSHNATKTYKHDVFEMARELEQAGAGEIMINCVDRDGEMQGYDLELAAKMREILTLPITIMGGAGSLSDMSALFKTCGIVGAAAGSLFVFKGKFRAVLISYPSQEQKDEMYSHSNLTKAPVPHVLK
jgi:cyclase